MDNATPSENSLAASGLLRLGALTGDERYAAARRRVRSSPSPVPHGFDAFGLRWKPPSVSSGRIEIVIVGPRRDPATRALAAGRGGRAYCQAPSPCRRRVRDW